MKVLVIALLVVAVAANSPAYKRTYPAVPAYPGTKDYPVSVNYPKASYPASSYGKSYDYAPMPYTFAWGVKDDYTYNDYTHEETSDDKGYVTGSYRVQLPDGRTQIVTYRADDYNGFVADVTYEGVAKYDDYKPAYKPAYKPEYRPAYEPEHKPEYKPAYKTSYQPEYKPAYAPGYKSAYKPEYKAAYEPEYKPANTAPAYPPSKLTSYPTRQYSSRY